MNERERAIQRDKDARERLAHDSLFLIKQGRSPWQVQNPSLLRDPEASPTRLELDALRCLSHGMTEAMVSDALGISPHSVKRRLRNVRIKLKAKNTPHACANAIRRGLID